MNRVLLIDDQVMVAEAVRRMLVDEKDISFFSCSDPKKAIPMALEIKPTVILQDLVMPDVDGMVLVHLFRQHPQTKEIPVIVLSSKEDAKIKADAFEQGANDYLVKLPDRIELLARLRYHSAAYQRLLERNEAYKILADQLSEAAAYVRSRLPAPLKGTITTDWRFVASSELGGDSFGYHDLDDDHFVIYLLDVCGHGVGAALLSVSIMNALQSQTLHDPSSVLKALNNAFPMEKHNQMFTTIWYGVYQKSTRELTFATGGHPPAILVTKDSVKTLKCPGMGIGAMPDAEFATAKVTIAKDSRLYVLSDGVYEGTTPLTFDQFLSQVKERLKNDDGDLARICRYAEEINGSPLFPDDFSILQVSF